mgnify:CR=1 FL=1
MGKENEKTLFDKGKILIYYYYERTRRDVNNFLKWLALAVLTGLVVGGASSVFAACIKYATEYRDSHLWVFLLLPIAGLIIVFLYEKMGRQDGGTNQVLATIRSRDKVPFRSAPLIFVATLLTHLTGGSAGREGASIQFGGSIGSWLGKLVHLDEFDQHVIIMCGMSAALASLEEGKVNFFAGGTGLPYFSTDTGAVLRAIEIEADAMLLAKAIDGIYDSDPKVNPEAKKYDEISIQDVIDQKLAAVDMTASILCMENKMPMLVFGLNEENSIVETMSGTFTGTKVTV